MNDAGRSSIGALMDRRRHRIFNHVGGSIKILIWTKGELVVIVCPIVLGIVLNQLLLGLILTAFDTWATLVFKRHFGKGQLTGFMYWYLPESGLFKGLPKSCCRDLIG